MSTEQAALSAFQNAAPPEPEPTGLDAIAADMLPTETTERQVTGAPHREVDAETCSRCKGRHADGDCPELAAERDLVDDPLRVRRDAR